ncbi:dipeptide ABC transporter ATP-binding protein [Metabacillus sp. GX 13764]|uniref:ABC transporter ATP-binding protein n=1 Tax=Metabacillus kandeliae TaxID=2900151 RepID=UPI001E4F1169|nr:dipeptide ABC transporter ATP-binding protein [Metabacillus kandeliae]MCD7036392.1 dipeptide ABC transporter ATP-binding protein [Metabacillus kandeliae]
MTEPLLKVENLKKAFPAGNSLFSKSKREIVAVNKLSLDVFKGETLGIVGESGCGKSTLGRLILRLLEATEGTVMYSGQNVFSLNKNGIRKIRQHMQMVFQDPYASLNPRHSVAKILEEPLIVHGIGTKLERREQAAEMLKTVGLNPDYARRYPHQFSGGQRQRIGIARALMTRPELIIADEPVSALDVSIQSQVLNLLKDLQEEFRLTYLFISHDLGVVRHISDRVAVMYLGEIVELAESESLYSSPLHPYTEALLSAVPASNPEEKRERILLKGELPNPESPPEGCAFHTRCPKAMEQCRRVKPVLTMQKEGHYAACHLYA